jgi:hypothetical protein
MKMEVISKGVVCTVAITVVAAFLPISSTMAAQVLGVCGFDSKTLSFKGTELQQAKCLLRPTLFAGELGPELKTLPAPFEKSIGAPFSLDTAMFLKYLGTLNIAPNALGGNLNEPLSRSVAGDKPHARYFVIHDVSYDLCEDKSLLPTSAYPDADWNKTSTWAKSTQAHLYNTRDGKLIAPQGRTFATPWWATKLEGQIPDLARGVFLHIENVQLRNVDAKPGQKTRFTEGKRKGQCINDRIAEKPGFTQVQYDRLALVYIAASHRAGKWLVPAYHLAVDDGVGEAHDDPQNFDLNDFGSKICGHLAALGRKECAP